MNRQMFATGVVALSVGLAGSASVSNAAFYGNFSSGSGTVSFLNVGDNNGLFGAPTVNGNNLDFSPTLFEADCATAPSCAPAPHNVSDLLILDVKANSGQFIDTIVMSEAGDTSLFAIPGAFAATTVLADVFIDVIEVAGVAVGVPINLNAQMVFTQVGNPLNNDGIFNTVVEGPGTKLWTGLLSVDLDALIAASPNAVVGQATLVRISLSNRLTAYAESGATAHIEKKDIDGLAITVVPEPGTALLFGLGLLGLASTGRSARDD